MNRIVFVLVVLSLHLIVLISCETDSPKLKLSRAERTLVDSIYRESIPSINKEMDSICLEYRSKQYQRKKDSIIAVRLSEIEQILPE